MDDKDMDETGAVVESLNSYQVSDLREPTEVGATAMPPASVSVAEAFQALADDVTSSALIDRVSGLNKPWAYMQTAYFSVSEMTGSATSLVVAGEPGGRLNFNGGILLALVPASSRVECNLRVSRGTYMFTARLVNWAGPHRAAVDAVIDETSLGRIDVFGTTTRSFVTRLGTGPHSFKLMEVPDVPWGPWIFLSLSAWFVPEVKI